MAHSWIEHRLCAGAYKAGDRGGISADYATFIYDAVLK